MEPGASPPGPLKGEKYFMADKKIDKLTPEQEVKLVEFREEWLAIGRNTAPLDREKCSETIGKLYAFMKLPPPEIRYVDGPYALATEPELMKQEKAGKARNLKDINISEALNQIYWASWDWYGYWLPLYMFVSKHIKSDIYSKEDQANLDLAEEVLRNCGFLNLFEEICFVCERPKILTVDINGRLHNTEGSALEFVDGWKIFYVNGIEVPAEAITDPTFLTVDRISSEGNIERKRAYINLFGQERFLEESNAKIEHQDDFGILYRSKVKGDEDFVMVKVVNSTPEPDGSFKDYFLRVPPATKTAKEGVAWSFNMPEKEYNPVIQT